MSHIIDADQTSPYKKQAQHDVPVAYTCSVIAQDSTRNFTCV